MPAAKDASVDFDSLQAATVSSDEANNNVGRIFFGEDILRSFRLLQLAYSTYCI